MTKRIWKNWRVQRSKPKWLNTENIQWKWSWLPREVSYGLPTQNPLLCSLHWSLQSTQHSKPGLHSRQWEPGQGQKNCSSQICPSYLWPKGNHFLCYWWVCLFWNFIQKNYTLYTQKDSFTFIYKAGCIHWTYHEMKFSLLGSPIIQSRVPRPLMSLGRSSYRWSSSQ